jgi:SAM-dependent methyltransferase
MDISPGNASTIGSYDSLSDEELAAMDPDGGFLRRTLLNPVIFGMLGDVRDRRILDAGCGQGYLARLLASRGAEVVAVEPAERLVRYGEHREAESPLGISYLRRDLSRLGRVGGPFDAVVANMVLLDIPDWVAALANCIGSLKTGGLFVYSLQHPCWVSGHFEEWAAKGYVEVSEYLNEYEFVGPTGTNFHRPLSAYVNATIRLGCAVTELAEPRLSEEQVEEDAQRLLCHIPPFVVIGATRQ